jgi:hypothetical protein
MLIKNRAGGLATVRALQTIGFSEDLLVHAVKVMVHRSGILLFKLLKIFPVLLFLIPGLCPKLFLVHSILFTWSGKYRKTFQKEQL